MIQRLRGPLLIVFAGLLPVLLLLISSQQSTDFSSPVTTYDTLARMAGLSALSLLALNIILSARLAIFDRLFLGLDRAYRFHRIIGGSVLILLLTHAMLITAKYSSVSLLSGYEFLKPNLDIALMAGKFALLVMLSLIFISIYITVRYKWFIMIQRLLGAMIFIGGYHALFVSGTDLQNNLLLLVYFIAVGGLAAGLYVYRSLLHKSLSKKLSYVVDSVDFSENITRIWLQPLKKSLAFYAGQFGFFRFSSAAVTDESHPFSISSGSNDSRLRISVKSIGDYTSSIRNIQIGDKVSVEGPYGNFSFTKVRSRNQVWVAGGIGVTPFLSMAHSLPAGYTVTLYYCTRTLAEAKLFLDELEQVSNTNPSFRVVPVCNDQDQHLDIETVRKLDASDYLLCAPLPMMHAIEKQLINSGVSRAHIHYEEFRLK